MNFITGQKLLKEKEFGQALIIFLDLEKNHIQDPRIYFYLGVIYFELNDFKKSIDNYNKFLKKQPNSVNALINLAIVNQSIGALESARKIYLKLIHQDKYTIRPYYGLFLLNPKYITNKYLHNILKIKQNSKLNLYEEGILYFILSKKEKENKNYKKEIKFLENFHSKIFMSKYSYNVSSQFYYNQIINQHFDKIFTVKDNLKNRNINPIFIIGLPRSGSTLIESIITSGLDNINSFGECHTINMSILEQIGPKIYTKNFDLKNFRFEIEQNKLSASVEKKYSNFNIKKNQLFVDKSLENFFNIEIILKIYPNAKFLHTFRNITDSIISIFQSMLPELSWTHSIEDILNYIDVYIQVLNHFKKKYPKSIMDVNLEKFTQNSEKMSKEIFKFCNLNWSKDVLNFYKRDDLHSKTLSFNQIKKKISKYDNLKYQPYFHLLDNYKERFRWININ